MRKPIDQATRAYIYSRDEGVCQHCGCKVAHDNFHIDHIVAVAKGGANEIDNYALSCPPCNIRKKHRDLPSEKLSQIIVLVKERNSAKRQYAMPILISKRRRVLKSSFTGKSRKHICKKGSYCCACFYDRLLQELNIKRDIELAAILGVSQPTVSGWRKRNSIDMTLLLAKLEGANVDWAFVITGKRADATEAHLKLESIRAVLNSAPKTD